MTERAVLIAGGYGVVGRRIAIDLASDFPVVVAGRHIELANEAAGLGRQQLHEVVVFGRGLITRRPA
jgi:hypothetical protein